MGLQDERSRIEKLTRVVRIDVIDVALDNVRAIFRLASWTFISKDLFLMDFQQDALEFYDVLLSYMRQQLPQ